MKKYRTRRPSWTHKSKTVRSQFELSIKVDRLRKRIAAETDYMVATYLQIQLNRLAECLPRMGMSR